MPRAVVVSLGRRRPSTSDLFSPALEELLGPRRRAEEPIDERHRDIARSVQAIYEEAFFNLIGALQEVMD